MSKSPNIGLSLTAESDTEKKFLAFRKELAGDDSESNMMILDRWIGQISQCLNGKAGKSASVAITLTANGWVETDSGFVQTLVIDGLTATQNGFINVAHEASAEQRECARIAALSVTGQADGELTITADGELPDADIPVCVILLE